jgi:DNA polymerase-3 subunit beta
MNLIASFERDQVIELAVTGSEVRITVGESNYHLAAAATITLTRVEKPADAVEADATALFAAFSRVRNVASTDEARVNLTGLHVTFEDGVAQITTTDSYRLAFATVPVTGFKPATTALVPAAAASKLAKTFSAAQTVNVSIAGVNMVVAAGSTVVKIGLIGVSFPDTTPFQKLPSVHQITVDSAALRAAISRLQIVADNLRTVSITPVVEEGVLLVVASDTSRNAGGAERVPAEISGEVAKFAVNARYLLEGVELLGSDNVTLHIADVHKPIAVRDDSNTSISYVVMPVRAT